MEDKEEAEFYNKLSRITQFEISFNHLVEYLIYSQKRYENGQSKVSGHQIILDFVQQDIIKFDMFLKLSQLIDNPELNYTFEIKE